LDDLAEEYRFLAESRGISIGKNIQRGLSLPGDEEKLRLAFSNVLDNALKYNVKEKEGFVEVVAHELENQFSVVVTNSGAKVPEEEYENIFKQFYRLEKSRSLEKGGSGLGLAIVKRTIELHGGTVSFRSEEERGGIINRVIIVF
jgi:signal transduction histidine kinase